MTVLVIETAIENLETVCDNVSSHFFPDEGKTKGRPRLDYKLSRLACYHIDQINLTHIINIYSWLSSEDILIDASFKDVINLFSQESS